MARILQQYAEENGKDRHFVMISSAKGLFFEPNYMRTKLEAEQFLHEKCPNLKITIIKPGFVSDA